MSSFLLPAGTEEGRPAGIDPREVSNLPDETRAFLHHGKIRFHPKL